MQLVGFAPSVVIALRNHSLQIRRVVVQYMGLSDHGRLRLRRLACGASALLEDFLILPPQVVRCNKKENPAQQSGRGFCWGKCPGVQGQCLADYALRQDFMKALRSSPFSVLALTSALQVFILVC